VFLFCAYVIANPSFLPSFAGRGNSITSSTTSASSASSTTSATRLTSTTSTIGASSITSISGTTCTNPKHGLLDLFDQEVFPPTQALALGFLVVLMDPGGGG
jgi:hypothetical protein